MKRGFAWPPVHSASIPSLSKDGNHPAPARPAIFRRPRRIAINPRRRTPRIARQSETHPDCRAATIKSKRLPSRLWRHMRRNVERSKKARATSGDRAGVGEATPKEEIESHDSQCLSADVELALSSARLSYSA